MRESVISIAIFVMVFWMVGCAVDKKHNRLLKGNLDKHGIETGDINAEGGRQSIALVGGKALEQDQRFLYIEKRNRRIPGWVGYELEAQENRKKNDFINGATVR